MEPVLVDGHIFFILFEITVSLTVLKIFDYLHLLKKVQSDTG